MLLYNRVQPSTLVIISILGDEALLGFCRSLPIGPGTPRAPLDGFSRPQRGMGVMISFNGYSTGGFYDEMFQPDGCPRPGAVLLQQRVDSLSDGELSQRQQAAERALLHMGITFNVYGDSAGAERIFPFDIIPRIVESAEWERLERGLKQRVYALNLFINDVYHEQKILKDKIIPEEILRSAKSCRTACVGLTPPRGIWCHITGTDLVRDRDGQMYVLEDNLCCPSGVSYVLENRQIMKRTFPQVFGASHVRPVDDYPSHLLAMLQYLSPNYATAPAVAVLTPGIYNSAYFEHSFLAQQMGVELVEGRDLVVADGFLQMHTTKGMRRVDVLYRRIDDDFLDPSVFRPDSLLGVPGEHLFFRAYRSPVFIRENDISFEVKAERRSPFLRLGPVREPKQVQVIK